MQKPRRCNENRKKAVHQDCPKQKDQSDPELDHILIQPVFSEPTKKPHYEVFSSYGAVGGIIYYCKIIEISLPLSHYLMVDKIFERFFERFYPK